MVREDTHTGLRQETAISVLKNFDLWALFALIAAVTFVYYSLMFPYSRQHPALDRLAFFELLNHTNGSLYLIPLLYAALRLSWERCALVWTVSMAAGLHKLLYLNFDLASIIANILLVFAPAIVVVSIKIENRRRGHEEALAAMRRREREAYLKLVLTAQEDERGRIARELHDEAIQTLTIAASYAEGLAKADRGANRVRAERVRDSILSVVGGLRRLTLDLSPSVLDNLGLVPALRWLAACLSEESGIKTEIAEEGVARRLSRDQEVSTFRIVQEALTNVRKHSGASRVNLYLVFGPRSLQIIISDNGKGFNPPEKLGEYSLAGKAGLIGMHQRARILNGTLNIDSITGHGTTITLRLVAEPLK